MSADNYLLVRRHPDGGWCHTMEFASWAPGPVREGTPSHPNLETALAAAARAEADGYYEYGISVDRGPARGDDGRVAAMVDDALAGLVDRLGMAGNVRADAAIAETRAAIISGLRDVAADGPATVGQVAVVEVDDDLCALAAHARTGGGTAPAEWAAVSFGVWRALSVALGLGTVDFDEAAP